MNEWATGHVQTILELLSNIEATACSGATVFFNRASSHCRQGILIGCEAVSHRPCEKTIGPAEPTQACGLARRCLAATCSPTRRTSCRHSSETRG
eukprot:3389031-Alexandrium_andersonii.AAC.1